MTSPSISSRDAQWKDMSPDVTQGYHFLNEKKNLSQSNKKLAATFTQRPHYTIQLPPNSRLSARREETTT